MEQLTRNFNLSEFVNPAIKDIPKTVIEKLKQNFAKPLQIVRNNINLPVVVSEFSGYRPHWWNVEHGRNYVSEHEFINKGATDLVRNDTLLMYLCHHLVFPRLIIYESKNIIHCDYKAVRGYRTVLYKMNSQENKMSLHWSHI